MHSVFHFHTFCSSSRPNNRMTCFAVVWTTELMKTNLMLIEFCPSSSFPTLFLPQPRTHSIVTFKSLPCLRPRRPWGLACRFLHSFYYYFSLIMVKHLCSENLRLWKHNALGRQTKILEPVSSTSRRGARAAYHDGYPRDFGSRITYTVS